MRDRGFNGYERPIFHNSRTDMKYDDYHRCKEIQNEMDVLTAKAMLGNNPVMGGKGLYEHSWDKLFYEEFKVLETLFHTLGQGKDFPEGASGLTGFFQNSGGRNYQPHINGVKFVIKKMESIPEFTEQVEIIKLLEEFLELIT